jgi:nitrogen-specific signal transduction histidine kinase/ActR/RegA family two-component response regulator
MNAPFVCDPAGQQAEEALQGRNGNGPNSEGKKHLDEQFLRTQRLESIGMLASGIAHDLNNVLAPIILAAPVLREHATHPDDLRIITSLEKSAERGVELVRQILSFAHGAASAQQVVQIQHLVQEAMGVTHETFPKNIRIIESIPGNLWPIMADATQIHQVLLNLCVNARDAMPAGGTLSISAENLLLDDVTARKIEGGRPGAWTVLQVEDSGTGIPADTLARIWEPFFTTKGEGKGTGLGLSTVRSIVASHNGFITLKTQPGRGTTFRVYLPAAEGATNGRLVEVATPKGDRGNGELILVVDDEPQIRDITAAMLSRNGYRVLTACDGAEAVALFATRSGEINVLITDLIMPNLDGAALANIAQHLNPRVKILAMSGLSSAGRSGKTERFGGAFLFKPFKIQTLLIAVNTLLHPAPVAEVA